MVFPNNSDEVVSALTICHKHKVPVAIRSGIGHSYIGQSTVNNGVVLNMQRLKGFDVSGVGQYIVKMGAGLDTIEVYTLMGLHDPPLAFPGGSHATVGIAGYFSGGGQSVLGPKYGVAVDRLVAADVVVYDKPSGAFKVVKATLSEGYEDLLFAVRGGMGGNYAVVLNFYYEAYPATRVLFSSGSMNNYVVGTYATRVREYMKFMADESTPADFGSTLLFRSTTNMSLSYYYSLCLCSPDGDCSVCDEVTSRFRKRTGTTDPTFFLPDTEEMSLVRAQWTQMNCGSVYPSKGVRHASEAEIQAAMDLCRYIGTHSLDLHWVQMNYYYPDNLSLGDVTTMVDGILGETCYKSGCRQSIVPYTHKMLDEPQDCRRDPGEKCTSFDHRSRGFNIEHAIYYKPGEVLSEVAYPWLVDMSEALKPISLNTKYQNYMEDTSTRTEWISQFFPHKGTYERLQAVKRKYNYIDIFDIDGVRNFSVEV
ncbi:hypothetical protein FOZ60_004453 [Perkinsus olseni]|uniref:FAD-binding PCMH-type domain-containing protein n=1 Tax=Perkinsus olseni TaxID=32597 RepID=A0A7J6PPN6_PEROL|nr:hypothetical protein FOZ60_004453 [Perkinsus olseni]